MILKEPTTRTKLNTWLKLQIQPLNIINKIETTLFHLLMNELPDIPIT